jgi:chromosome segregation ATPase
VRNEALSWVQDLWKIIETVATLTKEVESATHEIKEIRRDLNSLTLTVTSLKTELEHQKETTKLVLEHYNNQSDNMKENMAAKFDVLTTRLDAKIAEFENRLTSVKTKSKSPHALKSAAD